MSSIPTALRLLALLALAFLGVPGASQLESRPALELAAAAPSGAAPATVWVDAGARIEESVAKPSEAESEEEGHDGPAPIGGPFASGISRPLAGRVRSSGAAQHPARARVRRDLARGPPPARV